MTGRKMLPRDVLVALTTLGLPGGMEMLLGPPPMDTLLDQINRRRTAPAPDALRDLAFDALPLLPVDPDPKRSGQHAQFVPHHVDRSKRSKAKAARKARKKNRR